MLNKRLEIFDKTFYINKSMQQIISYINKNKIDYNLNDMGRNALHATLTNSVGNLKDRISFFIKNGTDLNSREGDDGSTPLHIAIANEMKNSEFNLPIYIMQEAVKYKKYINFELTDKEGKTILILAAKFNQEDIALYILNHFHLHQSNKIDLNKQDNLGNTALHYAAILGQLNLIQALLNQNADEDIENKKGEKPVDCCNYSKEEISAFLSSVEITPTRDQYAYSNFMRDDDFQELTIFKLQFQENAFASNKISEKKFEAEYKKSTVLDSHKLLQGKRRSLPAAQCKRIREEFKKMKGKSLCDAIVEKQDAANFILNTVKKTTIFFKEIYKQIDVTTDDAKKELESLRKISKT